MNTPTVGPALAATSTGSWLVTTLTHWDTSLHAMASVFTIAAAALSIYFTIRNRNKH